MQLIRTHIATQEDLVNASFRVLFWPETLVLSQRCRLMSSAKPLIENYSDLDLSFPRIILASHQLVFAHPYSCHYRLLAQSNRLMMLWSTWFWASFVMPRSELSCFLVQELWPSVSKVGFLLMNNLARLDSSSWALEEYVQIHYLWIERQLILHQLHMAEQISSFQQDGGLVCTVQLVHHLAFPGMCKGPVVEIWRNVTYPFHHLHLFTSISFRLPCAFYWSQRIMIKSWFLRVRLWTGVFLTWNLWQRTWLGLFQL